MAYNRFTRRGYIVTGISGVGKSRLVEKISVTVPMQILSASTLIQGALSADGTQSVSQDHLRTRHIDANQTALIEAFRHNVDPNAAMVLLDAHIIIDTPDGVVHISADVFRDLAADFMVFIEDDPQVIRENRDRDQNRSRPGRSVEQLADQQETAKLTARAISENLNIPIHFLSGGDETALAKILSAQEGAKFDV